MELLFLWIENDGITIKNQSFNFSNHIKFKLEEIGESNKRLTLIEQGNFIDGFFDNSTSMIFGNRVVEVENRIVNVTAVIGENGVGKTNLLNYIIHCFDGKIPINSQYILAFKDEEKNVIKFFHTLKDCELSIIGNISNFTIEEPIYEYNAYEESSFIDSNLIFYSPIFDLRDYPPAVSNEFKNYIDVSTNALIENDVLRRGDQYPDTISEIELHKFSNIRRQFDMVINPQLVDAKITFPSEINIIFHRQSFDPKKGQRNLTFDNEEIFFSLDKLLDKAWNDVNSKLNLIKKKFDKLDLTDKDFPNYIYDNEYRSQILKKLKIEFSYCLIHNFFNNLSFEYKVDLGVKFEDLKGGDLFEKTSFFFKNQKWGVVDGSKGVQVYNFYDSIFNLIDLVDFDSYPVQNDANFFVTDITGGVIALSNYEHYITSLPIQNKKNFLSTSWRNISSGESALMDLYSRLYFAHGQLIKEEKLDNNKNFVYLLIDEAEVGFHPQWQSEYFYNLINFVSKLYMNYKVQIILTSHSPFIVSDLPKENVIFLEKKENLCEVISFKEDQTFGANIHTLLSNQFFMKDGVIGKFARMKIQNELEPLLNNNIKKNDLERLKKFINTIGEPVLKSKLTEILTLKNNG